MLTPAISLPSRSRPCSLCGSSCSRSARLPGWPGGPGGLPGLTTRARPSMMSRSRWHSRQRDSPAPRDGEGSGQDGHGEVRPPESAARPRTLRRSMAIRTEGRKAWATTMHSSCSSDSAGRRGLASWPRSRSATSWTSLERSRRYSSPLSASLAAMAATSCCSTHSVFFRCSATSRSTRSRTRSSNIRICDPAGGLRLVKSAPRPPAQWFFLARRSQSSEALGATSYGDGPPDRGNTAPWRWLSPARL
jgi:hypothetical protein